MTTTINPLLLHYLF